MYLDPIVCSKELLLTFYLWQFCLISIFSRREATREVEAVHCFINFSFKGGKSFWRSILIKHEQFLLTFLHCSPTVKLDQIVALSWSKNQLKKGTLSFYYPAAHSWKEKQKIKMQFHSQNARKRKRFAWQSLDYSRMVSVSEDAQCWPNPPLELQGWTLSQHQGWKWSLMG